MPPTAEDFRQELYKVMNDAVKQAKDSVDINAGELHGRLGDYPGPNHRMPNCCQVMKAAMAADYGDVVMHEPPGGHGASLTIRYILPRRA